jgi:cellulose synthase/poly-beta-1,6-N-acetylglucosamine synthase-like glycosyltransferase
MIFALIGAGLVWGYAYAGYPLLLMAAAARRTRRTAAPHSGARADADLPLVTITVPAYNEAASIGDTLERLLATDYPPDRRQILVISDASTDGTDDVVRSYASRGVELLRMPERRGKTAAENAAWSALRGSIIVNTDASVRVHPDAVRHLVAALDDPSVGVASGRDVSVERIQGPTSPGESAYVGYEMWVRDLETQVDGIVGASGCLYAIRAELHRYALPEHLSRDFAAALVARRQGFRAVSVPQAICFVPQSSGLHREYRRKVRTMARGLATLWYARELLDVRRYGAFSWMLASHKLCRWILPWTAVGVTLAALVTVRDSRVAPVIILGAGLGLAAWALVSRREAVGRRVPRPLAMIAYGTAGLAGGAHAWIKFLTGQRAAVWEPTRRVPTSAIR